MSTTSTATSGPALTTTALRRRGLRVSELAAAAGVTSDTVRYYERAGLLPSPRRTGAGYREYDDTAVERLSFVQGCQRLGLKLRDIADLLTIRDTGVCPCEPAEQLLRRRLGEVDAEIERLTALRQQMLAMIQSLPSDDCQPPSPAASWCSPAEGRRSE